MSNIPEDVLRRMRSILELTRRGVGGERVNAQRMLSRLMAKHGITLEQLEQPEVRRYWFTYQDSFERKLLVQILCKVMATPRFESYRRPRRRAMGLDMTSAQHLETLFLFTLLRLQIRKEVDRLFTAFITKHAIYWPKELEDQGDSPPLSAEERARIREMMRALEEVPVHKQLERK